MARPPRGERMTIGAVVAALKPRYPDISISKIRFLESEGLLRPQRTASGYRTYTASDVERLEYILTAQRERFWPLRVIRDALDAIDRGLEPPDPVIIDRPQVPTVPADPDLPSAAEFFATEGASTSGSDDAAQDHARSPLRLTREEVADTVGLDLAMIDALCTYGLLRPDADGHFPATALPVATAAAALAAYGIEARHLRPFRTAAEREIGLVEQVLSTQRGHSQEDEAKRADLLRHCIALHTALVKAALRDSKR